MQKTFDEIAEMYKGGMCVYQIEKATGVNGRKVKRILITKGLIKTEEADLFRRGCWTVEEIAEHLGKGIDAVQKNMPYEKIPTEEDAERAKENIKKEALDGWHKIKGYDVYIEGGRIIRGLSSDGQKTTYPYRKCKTGGWDNVSGISINAFRAGWRRGTIDMKVAPPTECGD